MGNVFLKAIFCANNYCLNLIVLRQDHTQRIGGSRGGGGRSGGSKQEEMRWEVGKGGIRGWGVCIYRTTARECCTPALFLTPANFSCICKKCAKVCKSAKLPTCLHAPMHPCTHAQAVDFLITVRPPLEPRCVKTLKNPKTLNCNKK